MTGDIMCERKKTGCIIMASGLGKRFGSNKLLAQFQGKTLIETVLDLTEGDLFTNRIVLTRTREVEELCCQRNIPVLYHELPERNQAIRLGVEALEKGKELDGILFCPCDQPLLKRESLVKILECYQKDSCSRGIYRLRCKEIVGAPVLFEKIFFEELKNLPVHSGGSYLMKKYPEKVRYVSAASELELYDVDTKEDLEYLNLCVKTLNKKLHGVL